MKYYLHTDNGDKTYYLAGFSAIEGETECTWTVEFKYRLKFIQESAANSVLNRIGRGTVGKDSEDYCGDYDEDERWR